MNAQELRNLQEAYLEVYNELDEGKLPLDKQRRSRIGRQIGKKVQSSAAEHSLSKDTIYPKGLRVSMKKSAIKKVKQAHNMMNALKAAINKTKGDNTKKSFPNRLIRSDGQGIHDSYGLYDIILSHLLDEGYAETPEQAEVIMVNMSEDWRVSICEAAIEAPRERVGALTNIDIPEDEKEAARKRTLAKAKAMREKREAQANK